MQRPLPLVFMVLFSRQSIFKAVGVQEGPLLVFTKLRRPSIGPTEFSVKLLPFTMLQGEQGVPGQMWVTDQPWLWMAFPNSYTQSIHPHHAN